MFQHAFSGAVALTGLLPPWHDYRFGGATMAWAVIILTIYSILLALLLGILSRLF